MASSSSSLFRQRKANELRIRGVIDAAQRAPRRGCSVQGKKCRGSLPPVRTNQHGTSCCPPTKQCIRFERPCFINIVGESVKEPLHPRHGASAVEVEDDHDVVDARRGFREPPRAPHDIIVGRDFPRHLRICRIKRTPRRCPSAASSECFALGLMQDRHPDVTR